MLRSKNCLAYLQKERWWSWSQTDHDFCLRTKLTQNAAISTRLEHIYFNSKCFLWVTGCSKYLSRDSRSWNAGWAGFKTKVLMFFCRIIKYTLQTTFWDENKMIGICFCRGCDSWSLCVKSWTVRSRITRRWTDNTNRRRVSGNKTGSVTIYSIQSRVKHWSYLTSAFAFSSNMKNGFYDNDDDVYT